MKLPKHVKHLIIDGKRINRNRNEVRREYQNDNIPAVIPAGVTALTFQYCQNIPEIPAGVTHLEFYWCDNIPAIPAGVTSLTFIDCNNIPAIPAGVTSLKFYGCNNIPAIPAGVTSLVFYRCNNIPKIPDTVTTIGGIKPKPHQHHITTYIYYMDNDKPSITRHIEQVTLRNFEDAPYSKEELNNLSNLTLENCPAMYDQFKEEAAAAFLQPWLCQWKGIEI